MLLLVSSSVFPDKIASSRRNINLRRQRGLLIFARLVFNLLVCLHTAAASFLQTAEGDGICGRGLSSGDSEPALLNSFTTSSKYLKSSSSPSSCSSLLKDP